MVICKKCRQEMFIDEFNGWVWTCPSCGKIGRKAKDSEIKKQESEFLKINSKNE